MLALISIKRCSDFIVFCFIPQSSSNLHFNRRLLATLGPFRGKKMLPTRGRWKITQRERSRKIFFCSVGIISYEEQNSQRTCFTLRFPEKGFSKRSISQEGNITSPFSLRKRVFVSTGIIVREVRFFLCVYVYLYTYTHIFFSPCYP